MRSLLSLALLVVCALGTVPGAQAATSYVSFQPQVRGMGCLQPRTRAMIAHLTSRVGPIQITSTCGGRHAHNSEHYRGAAVDFRPKAKSVAATLAVLRQMPEVGGIGSYSGGLIHADIGQRRMAWYGRARQHLARGHFRARYASAQRYRRGNG